MGGRATRLLLLLLAVALVGHGACGTSQDEATPLCGSFDLRGYGCSLVMGEDAAPCLRKALASGASALYADAFARDAALYIGSDVTLTKPLVAGNYLPVYVAQGATLTFAAQPYLPRPTSGSVFTGPGRVSFAGSAVFRVQTEWWPEADGTEGLQSAVDACAGARCTVLITGLHFLSKGVAVGPNVAVWATPGSQLKAGTTGAEGLAFGPGDYSGMHEQFLPPMIGFKSYAIRATGTSNLRAYTPVITTGGDGIVLATTAAARAVRNTSITAILMASLTKAGVAVEGAVGGSLSGVSTYSASYVNIPKGPPASMVELRGEATANADVRFAWTNFSPAKLNAGWAGLRNSARGVAGGLAYTVRAWAGAFPTGAPIVIGKFSSLVARVVVTLAFPGQVQMGGARNYVEWGGLNRMQAYAMAATPVAGPAPTASLILSSRAAVTLPRITSWPAGASRSFYIYHLMTSQGGATNFVLGPGPVPPSHPLLTNPGLAVVSVVDDSRASPNRVKVTFKNVSGRTLTDADVHYLNSPQPLTFTLTAASPPSFVPTSSMERMY